MEMNKKKFIMIVVVSIIAGFSIPLAIQVFHYSNILDEPRLNLTKVQEHLDRSGSLDDPIALDLYESKK